MASKDNESLAALLPDLALFALPPNQRTKRVGRFFFQCNLWLGFGIDLAIRRGDATLFG